MRGWIADYRRGGFDALYPKPRTDRGKPRRLPPEVAERLITLKTENDALSVRAIIQKAQEGSMDHPLAHGAVKPVSSSSLRRLARFRSVPHEKGAVRLYPERHLDADH